MSENRKKTYENHHFNIFFGYNVLLIQLFSLSLLTEYIKITQIGGLRHGKQKSIKEGGSRHL